METANRTFAQAIVIKNSIVQHQVNIDYWLIVYGALIDEKHMHTDMRFYRREKRKILKLIRKNSLRVQKLQKQHDRLTRLYKKYNRQEGWG